MAIDRRVQMLMDPEEYGTLERIARAQRVSVAELIRRAVREKYLRANDGKRTAVEDLISMDLPVVDWEELEAEVEEAHDAGLPR